MSPTTLARPADPYHSRLADKWEFAPREDPVVWSDAQSPLDKQTVQQFAMRGFHHDPSCFNKEEVSQWLAEAERLAKQAADFKDGVIREPKSQAVRSIFRLEKISPVFQELCADPRIADVARQILGSEVYLHQTRINFKPAFDGKEFFWHSDFETWHMEDGMPRMRALSVSISLTESNEFNGPLMVIPGSHKTYIRCQGETPQHHFEQSLKRQEIGVPSREAMQDMASRLGIVAPKGPAGSALFFDCNLMHGSSSNLSPFPRTNLFFVFNSVENPCTKPFNEMPPRPDFLASRSCQPL